MNNFKDDSTIGLGFKDRRSVWTDGRRDSFIEGYVAGCKAMVSNDPSPSETARMKELAEIAADMAGYK